MKNFAFPILNISSLFILYLSSQSGLYNCMNTGKTASSAKRSNENSGVHDNSLSTEWSEKGCNFMDLVKNGYLKNEGDLDEVKDYLADELASKIKDKLSDFLKDEKIFYDLENMDDQDKKDLKNYLKDMSEYIGLKAADILNSNIEESLKPLLSNSSFASLKEAMGSTSAVDLKIDDEDDETKEEKAKEEKAKEVKAKKAKAKKAKAKKAKAKKGDSKKEDSKKEGSKDENAKDENAKDDNSSDGNSSDDNADDMDVDEATEDFINELVDVYEENQQKDLEEYAQEIKTHNNLD
ncbi:hypothetical protein PVMG_01572 [Plasmodium vivax Mauritania I]|uniref:Male development gene 1 n=1 Tax=Plasmodium vivax Mauritania I TaxID=1035515 RepID=A0A0J9T436_PLAVI|nr:hypothetical protein PVMG_01572 [Plasmodium vivax Mauritania I]